MSENIIQEIMGEFGSRTGLSNGGAGAACRYLWTDAFAVCNYLALYKQSGKESYLHQALSLVDQVHEFLGRHREDDPRHGWISGLEEREGRLHPTAGGLRIGKKMPERQPDEPFDAALEWDRDGQYYHYLTKWMHTLCCLSRVIENPIYAAWAKELAERAHRAFCYSGPEGTRRLFWKMSIDLSRPLVSSMGHHDPLDGLITCMEIQSLEPGSRSLDDTIGVLADMCRSVNWTTPDPLGLGGLLTDAWRLAKLRTAGVDIALPGLLQDMLEAAVVGLSIYSRDNSLHQSAEYRLAFRELGLSIGLQAAIRLITLESRNPELFRTETRVPSLLEELGHYIPLQEQIEDFWLESDNREVTSWTDHIDINMVMLATSLAPEGFLDF